MRRTYDVDETSKPLRMTVCIVNELVMIGSSRPPNERLGKLVEESLLILTEVSVNDQHLIDHVSGGGPRDLA